MRLGKVQVMRTALEVCHTGWRVHRYRSGACGRINLPKFGAWYMYGKIKIDPIITYRLSLKMINKGFDLMYNGELNRTVVVY